MYNVLKAIGNLWIGAWSMKYAPTLRNSVVLCGSLCKFFITFM